VCRENLMISEQESTAAKNNPQVVLLQQLARQIAQLASQLRAYC
jgi:hypothetical protein